MTSTALAREIERYVAKTPKSRALQAEAERVLPGGARAAPPTSPLSLLRGSRGRPLRLRRRRQPLPRLHAERHDPHRRPRQPHGDRGPRRADPQGDGLQHADRGAGPGREAPLRPHPLARHDPLHELGDRGDAHGHPRGLGIHGQAEARQVRGRLPRRPRACGGQRQAAREPARSGGPDGDPGVSRASRRASSRT